MCFRSHSVINLMLFMSCLIQIAEIDTHIRDIKSILYGSSESEPAAEACAQLTQEFFKGNTMRLLILCLPKLNLEVIINIALEFFNPSLEYS